MNKTYIAIIIVLLVIGGLFFAFRSKTLEAPTVIDNQVGGSNINGETPTAPGTTPGTTVTTTTTTTAPTGIVCTMEAKLCPDGSYVGRSGPKCEFTACPTPAPVKEFTVTGKNYSFTPSTMTVNKGDKVKITFKNSNGTHNLNIDEFSVATNTVNAGSEQTVEFIADKTGSFQYYCSVGNHRAMGMWGTLTVK